MRSNNPTPDVPFDDFAALHEGVGQAIGYYLEAESGYCDNCAAWRRDGTFQSRYVTPPLSSTVLLSGVEP